MSQQSALDKESAKRRAKKLALSNNSLNQTLLRGGGLYSKVLSIDALQVLTYRASDVTTGIAKTFIEYAGPIGISPGLDPKDQSIIALAICQDKRCLIIEFPRKRHESQARAHRNSPEGELNQGDSPGPDVNPAIQDILSRPAGFYAFDLSLLVLALYSDLGLRVSGGVDIQSAFPGDRRAPLDVIREVIGDQSLTGVKVIDENVVATFRDLSYDANEHICFLDIAQRAWISHFLPGFENALALFDSVGRIDTLNKFTCSQLDVLAKFAQDSTRLEYLKPMETKHEFSVDSADMESGFNIKSLNYKSKIRQDQNIKFNVQNSNGASYYLSGMTAAVQGRSSSIITPQPLSTSNKTIATITSIGRDGPTQAESKRSAMVLSILQKSSDVLSENPWIQNFWFPGDNGQMTWPESWSLKEFNSFSVLEDHRKTLNSSQIVAVEQMLSDMKSDRVILIQGPPGSGKTSVIAKFVELAISNGTPGIWLVAQSNVAVKNIAEKLISVGFTCWRLLVSKDFHYDWHEHLYSPQLSANLIRSEEFKRISSKHLSNCHVILCTLSMMSSRWLRNFTCHVPIHTLVVDEASQIEIGDYLSVFSTAQYSLRKMCLIGDDRQLPPYGQEDIGNLQSVFEVDHFRPYIVFLDTQYRMPPQIGDFISKAVYNGQLKSNSQHPIKDDVIACRLVDTPGNEQSQGNSYMNIKECEAVLKIAEYLQENGKSYRIITPYDGQRTYIEHQMEARGLDWGDKCFNVDSFQGNEDDYIIISVVRSFRIGFLANLRRTNVMLTRCKKGMFIVSSRKFLVGPGEASLVGALLQDLEERVGEAAWLTLKELEEGKI